MEGDSPLRSASFCELFFSCCGVERGWERKEADWFYFWGLIVLFLFFGFGPGSSLAALVS